MKLSLALASLAALAASAAADCSEIWRGQLHYSQNFAAGDGKDGWVQYNNGALTVDFNADHGVDVRLQRCGERDTGAGKADVARLVFPDNKCLHKRGDDISVGDCGSNANVIQPGMVPDGKNLDLFAWDNRDYTEWFAQKDGSLGYRRSNKDGFMSRLTIFGY